MFDRDIDGLLNADELGMALRTLGLHVTEGNITQIMSKMPKHAVSASKASGDAKVFQRMIDLPNFLKVVVSIGSQSSQPVKCVVQCFDEQDGGTAFLVDKSLRDMNAGQTPIVPNGTELNVLRIEDDGKLCFVRWLDAEGYVETRHLVPHDEHGHAGDASELSAMLEKSRSAGQQATSAKWFPRMYDIEKALNSFYDPALVRRGWYMQLCLCMHACMHALSTCELRMKGMMEFVDVRNKVILWRECDRKSDA